MKKVFFTLLTVAGMLYAGDKASAQIKVGVFDIDAMVQSMPGYSTVDSLLRVYQADSLNAEYQTYLGEYQRLDSTLKADSAAKAPATKIQFENQQKQQVMAYLVNWNTYTQNKLQQKQGVLAQDLYEQVSASYQKILKSKGYTLVLKPGAYEFGSKVDNLFISVAKDLKLTTLPQELLILGPDPDAPAQSASPANGGAKPAGTKPASH
ncbi:MAG TPA: OmpH family outer membrane protein [Chitinophagaceae bacterium]|nr:OmpH family outer membrane protein [Chitinophagaceae bacterium]